MDKVGQFLHIFITQHDTTVGLLRKQWLCGSVNPDIIAVFACSFIGQSRIIQRKGQ